MMALLFYNFFLIFLVFLSNWFLILNFFILGFFYFFFSMNIFSYFSNLSYFVGCDSISFILIFLSFWVSYLMIISSMNLKLSYSGSLYLYMVMFLLFSLIFSFSTYNFFLFYFFFESSLIPILLLIFGWGYQPERLASGFYLLFYTLFGSFPLLLSLFYIYSFCGSLFFDLIFFNFNFYIYLGLILGFLFKMPMFMFHFWLPKAHVEAPISGSMILAAVLLKLGGYGLIRSFKYMYMFVMKYNLYFMILSLFGIILISLICMYQFDMKSLIAYSSVCHMGIVICGIFTINYWGLIGSLIMMIGHGLCSSGLFCLANIVYERTKSRSFYINKGLINLMPSLSLFWFLLCSNNMSSPPSLNLLGEIILINSLMSWCTYSFMVLFLSCFLSCCYSMYLYSNTQHGLYYSGLKYFMGVNVREFYLLFMHFFPLNFLVLKCDIYFIWI